MKEKLLELLLHPVVKAMLGRALEKATKRLVQVLVAHLIVVTLAADPTLESVNAQAVLTALVVGGLEIVRTSLKRVLPASLSGLL